MASHAVSRWRFSLKALLLLMLACAVLLGTWRAFGMSVVVGVSFVLLSTAPVFILSRRWKPAYLAAYSAVYGPFIVMATYTLLFVACTHCKATTWKVLPAGPGLIPADLLRRSVDLPRLEDTLWFALGFFFGGAMVAGLTWLLATRTRWWQAAGVTTMLALNVWGAVVVLALIRS